MIIGGGIRNDAKIERETLQMAGIADVVDGQMTTIHHLQEVVTFLAQLVYRQDAREFSVDNAMWDQPTTLSGHLKASSMLMFYSSL
jgi:phosphoribosylformimino-5-aminoimidazole carboxamide ribonucleotide (ProFAR) isomerase